MRIDGEGKEMRMKTVVIRGTMRVRYNKTVTMTDEIFKSLKEQIALYRDKDNDLNEMLSGWVDFRDDACDSEPEDFECYQKLKRGEKDLLA
jgi:hypothetical protein